jgi:molybdopterin-binding protein
VPAGLYAKAALEKLGLWNDIQPRLAQSENVRAALALVARGEATLGIVYETDAKAEPRVKVVATFPADSHPPIVYPFALTANAKGDGPARFLSFLQNDSARAVFMSQGFAVLPRASTTKSGGHMKLSARNVIAGTIVEVHKGQTTAHVRIDIGGTVITASITNEAVDELKLAKGQKAHAVIKASDVMIATD